jgi:hypothetical protein
MVGRRLWAIGVLALCAAAMAVAPVSASAGVRWGAPASVDATPPLADSTFSPTALACPSAGLCVAVDDPGGFAIAWSNPALGQPDWTASQINFACPYTNYGDYCSTDEDGLTAVGCASATLCVAGGPDDALFMSTNPLGAVSGSTSPVSAWRGNTVSGGLTYGTIRGVSCASPSVCVAVDDVGKVLSLDTSIGAWTRTAVDTHPLTAVACPSASLCIAVDVAGDVLSSSDPGGAATAWAAARIDPGRALTGVSCPSTGLCLAVDGAGHVWASTNPAGGSSAWNATAIDPGGALSSVVCPAVTLCIALDGNGELATSRNPAGGAGDWTLAPLSRAVARSTISNAASVSCASITLCVAIDGVGDTWSSTDPAAGAATWTASQIGRYNDLDVLACPAASLCVAGDDSGNILSSSAPAADASAWRASRVEPGHRIESIQCPSASLCIASDDRGDLLTASHPGARAPRWRRSRLSARPVTLSCTSVGRGANRMRRRPARSPILCLGYDSHGRMFVSTDPRHGASAWTALGVPVRGLRGVSCQSRSLCVGLTKSDRLVSSHDPADHDVAWTVHRSPEIASYDGSATGDGISCATATLCVGTFTGDDGKYQWPVVATANPSARRIKWRTVYSELPGNSEGPVEPLCTSPSVCFAVGAMGLISSTRPQGGPTAWTQTAIPIFANDIACPSGRLCVAVSASGEVVIGNR